MSVESSMVKDSGTINEAQLLADIAEGNSRSKPALKRLYQYYAHRFIDYFLRRGVSRSDAEDLCQDCFVKIVRSLKSSPDISAHRAWLWSAARSLLLDHVKAKRSALVDEWQEPDWFPSNTASMMDDEHGLQRCIERQFREYSSLSPEAAQVIQWSVIEGFSAVEISELIGRGHGATREFLSQIRKKLREVLEVCETYLRG